MHRDRNSTRGSKKYSQRGKIDNMNSYTITTTVRAPGGAQDCRPTTCSKYAVRQQVDAGLHMRRAWGGAIEGNSSKY